MTLLSIGIVWAGYTVLFYGFTNLKGPGIGFTDLVLPQRVGKVDSFFKGQFGDFNPGQVPNFGGGEFDAPTVAPSPVNTNNRGNIKPQ